MPSQFTRSTRYEKAKHNVYHFVRWTDTQQRSIHHIIGRVSIYIVRFCIFDVCRRWWDKQQRPNILEMLFVCLANRKEKKSRFIKGVARSATIHFQIVKTPPSPIKKNWFETHKETFTSLNTIFQPQPSVNCYPFCQIIIQKKWTVVSSSWANASSELNNELWKYSMSMAEFVSVNFIRLSDKNIYLFWLNVASVPRFVAVGFLQTFIFIEFSLN